MKQQTICHCRAIVIKPQLWYIHLQHSLTIHCSCIVE